MATDKDAVTTGTVVRMGITFAAMVVSAALVGLMLLMLNRLDDHGQRLARIETALQSLGSGEHQHASR